MEKLHKYTTWNIEWLANLLRDIDDTTKSPSSRKNLEIRLEAIYQTIHEIDPDVLCITEGPNGEILIDKFVKGLVGYSVVKRKSGDPYRQRGRQWIWFIVKDNKYINPELLPIKVWQEYTRQASNNEEHKQNWPVNYWGEINKVTHSHYRHPQVLVLNIAGIRVELVGGHFKSKLTTVGNYNSSDNKKKEAFVKETLTNRVKLATEAQNVRYYIDQRFNQEHEPAIFLLGDLNDGPGKEYFERQYLFFDLLNNIQGDVFEAEKFLNHALFDFKEELRWTVQFKDKIESNRNPNILLDHILFTQALVRGNIPLQINSGAGKVEHEIFDRINAQLPTRVRLSDHKPVSCLMTQIVS